MATDAEVIKLILDMGGNAKDTQDLIDKFNALRVSASQVAETYQTLATAGQGYEVIAHDTNHEFDIALAKKLEQVQMNKVLAQSTDTLAAAQGAAGVSTNNMSQRILNLGRAAQDLAQGGLGGIINNIEGIVGGGGLAAGILTGLGTAAFVAAPYIKQLYGELTNFAEKIPESTDRMTRFSESISRNAEELKKLKDQQSLEFFEMRRYQDLLVETTKLEQAAAIAKEARGYAGMSKTERGRAGAVRETIDEHYAGSQDLVERLVGAGVDVQRAEEIVAGALRGFANDIQALGNNVPGFAAFYRPNSPEAKANQKLAEDQAKQRDDEEKAKAKLADEALKQKADEAFKKQENDRQAQKASEDWLAGQGGGKKAQPGDSVYRPITEAQQDQLNRKRVERFNAAKQIQRGAAQQGVNMDFGEALSLQKRQQAELKQLQAQGLQAIMGNLSQQAAQIEMWKRVGGEAQRMRTNQNEGWN